MTKQNNIYTRTKEQNLLECNNGRFPHIKSRSGWVKIPVLNTYRGVEDSNGCIEWTLQETEVLTDKIEGCE